MSSRGRCPRRARLLRRASTSPLFALHTVTSLIIEPCRSAFSGGPSGARHAMERRRISSFASSQHVCACSHSVTHTKLLGPRVLWKTSLDFLCDSSCDASSEQKKRTRRAHRKHYIARAFSTCGA